MERRMTQLPHRGILKIQGEDRAFFLQGLISNDIYKVASENAIYAILLTPQGRFLYDFFITEKEGAYFLDVEINRIDALLKKFALYKLRSKVSFSFHPDLKVFALWGEGIAGALGIDERLGSAKGGYYMDPRFLELGARSMGGELKLDFQLATPEDYDLYRLSLGIPEGGKELIPEKTIPLEAGLDELNAISWTKGCYMGQELTARTKYRGLVRKKLFPVKIEGGPPSEGTEILLNGASAGDIRSHRNDCGLALLRLEAFKAYEEEQAELRWGNAFLKPYVPVWMRREDPS